MKIILYDWNGPPNGLYRARCSEGFEAGNSGGGSSVGGCAGDLHGISLINLCCLSHEY